MQHLTAREKLLSVADHEFYASGIGNTGINTLTDLAGVARMSLYKNFKSKDEVILEYLERRHEEWVRFHSERVLRASTPLMRAMALPYSYIDRAEARGEHFRGCGLLNAAGEMQTNSAIRNRVFEIKGRVRKAFIEDLLEAGLPNPQALGESLFLLLEGAMVHAGLEECRDALDQTVATIEKLLQSQLLQQECPVIGGS